MFVKVFWKLFFICLTGYARGKICQWHILKWSSKFKEGEVPTSTDLNFIATGDPSLPIHYSETYQLNH
jgi:hypothetical protein